MEEKNQFGILRNAKTTLKGKNIRLLCKESGKFAALQSEFHSPRILMPKQPYALKEGAQGRV